MEPGEWAHCAVWIEWAPTLAPPSTPRHRIASAEAFLPAGPSLPFPPLGPGLPPSRPRLRHDQRPWRGGCTTPGGCGAFASRASQRQRFALVQAERRAGSPAPAAGVVAATPSPPLPLPPSTAATFPSRRQAAPCSPAQYMHPPQRRMSLIVHRHRRRRRRPQSYWAWAQRLLVLGHQRGTHPRPASRWLQPPSDHVRRD